LRENRQKLESKSSGTNIKYYVSATPEYVLLPENAQLFPGKSSILILLLKLRKSTLGQSELFIGSQHHMKTENSQ